MATNIVANENDFIFSVAVEELLKRPSGAEGTFS
jgi:hypothetical protein